MQRGEAEFPYIDYPAEVFFGKVMATKIVPALRPSLLAIPKVETALTLAALEMAASGVGVAWLPKSVAQPRIENGQIVDTSDILPSCAPEIRAVRLFSNHGPAETALWSQLMDRGAADQGAGSLGAFTEH
jgi:LysR family transcriptional regulator, hypochlorite-specific transcription factor HypT